jgi:sugar phosphate isomerase/epimerase
MLIGAMNHPAGNVTDEIAWMADLGLEFIDLTLEPPAASAWRVNPDHIRAALDRYRMEAVGHTGFYLPIGSPFEEVRRGAIAELRRCIEVFAQIGVRCMNLHPDRYAPMHDRSFYIRRNLESLRELLGYAEHSGVSLMLENLPGDFNTPRQLGELLDPIPQLGLHLDIGHANLQTPYNQTEDFLRAYGERLRHVHLHDNRGGDQDLHLPLGAGTVDVPRSIRALHAAGYDGTITLEVFTPDRHHLAYSRDVLREVWTRTAEEAQARDREPRYSKR